MAINWTYLRERGGENFELLLATLMRREFTAPPVRQVNPGRGDDGVDLIRATADGLEVWQVKVYTSPLTPSQQKKVKNSWDTFVAKYVEAGQKIASYTLVTPWTPTPQKTEWFSTLTAGHGFPTWWDGAAFLNGIAAKHPEIIALFERGPAAFDEQVMAKAVIAGTTPNAAPATMYEAITAGDEALRKLRDQLDPHYLVNVSVRTSTTPGAAPPIGRGEAGVLHRLENIDGDRWRIESVVPRYPEAPEVAPIKGNLRFNITPGTPEAEQYNDWQYWGTPLKNFVAETSTTGGPFPHPLQQGRISIGAPVRDEPLPDLIATVLDPNGNRMRSVRLRVKEATQGLVGGGLRILASSFYGHVVFEFRTGSSVADSSCEITFPPQPGAKPRQVAHELEWTDDISAGTALLVEADGHGKLFKMSDLAEGNEPLATFAVASRLARLQAHADEDLLMPDIRQVEGRQIDALLRLSDVYDGNAFEGTWDEGQLTVEDPAVLERLVAAETLAKTELPLFVLGDREYKLATPVTTTYFTPRLPDRVDAGSVSAGDTITVIAGDDNRAIVTALPAPPSHGQESAEDD